MTLFECDEFKLTVGLFKNHRVIDKVTGRSIKPRTQSSLQLGRVYHQIRILTDDRALRGLAENFLYFDFGRIVLGIRMDLDQVPFLVGAIPAAKEYIRRAEVFRDLDRHGLT